MLSYNLIILCQCVLFFFGSVTTDPISTDWEIRFTMCMTRETERINVTTVSSFTAGTAHQQIHMLLTSFLRTGSGNTVTLYHSLSVWHNVVFINVAKVDAGCVRVVKLLQAWRHVNKLFYLSKQPKYWMTAHHMLCLAWYICCDAVWSFLHGTDG